MSECWETAEIRIRAERRLGELLAVTEKAEGAKGIGNPKSAVVKADRTGPLTLNETTLGDLGVSFDLSSRAQSVGLTNQPVGCNMYGMAKNKPLTITEVARRGGRSTLKKYGKRQLRAWGKLGGRPPKKKGR